MVLRNHNVYGFGSARSSGRIGSLRPLDAGDVTADPNREEAQLLERGHLRCGRLGALFDLTLSGRSSRAIEWRGST
jgi:hypothetical protein